MDTILLVDDNPLRAATRKQVLDSEGISVWRAGDPPEALCMVETPEVAQDLALMITGHATTGISAPEFVAEFRGRMPMVPVLVMGAGPGSEEEYEGISGVYFSQVKTPDELRTLVTRLVSLGEKRSA